MDILNTKTKLARMVVLICAVVTLATLAGCRNNPILPISDDNRLLQPSHGGVLVADPQSPLPDVPRPVGFGLVSSKSYGRIDQDGTRQVHHVYQGQADFASAVGYYRQVLKEHGWQGLSQSAEGSATILNYRSSRELLQIKLTKSGKILTVIVMIHRA